MNDFEEIPLEPVAGERHGSALGDRLLVGLAVVVLLAGLTIGAGNFLSQFADDEPVPVAAASAPATTATPGPSRTPRPSPTPRALRELTLTPGTPPPPPDYGEPAFIGWLEAIGEVIVRAAPDHGAHEVARLAPGEVIQVERGDESESPWVQTHDVVSGWAATLDAQGSTVARLHEQREDSYPGGIFGLSGGEDGFVGVVWPPQTGRQPMFPFAVASADGEEWRAAGGLASSWHAWAAAWGPSGWLGASVVEGDTSGELWIWESADGLAWTPLGHLEGITGYPAPRQMVGSDGGYLLVLDGPEPDGSGVWFSPDGILWQETHDPLGVERARRDGYWYDDRRVAPAGSGFVAWTGSDPWVGSPTRGAYSANGRSWQPLDIDRLHGTLWLAAAGQRLLAIAHDGEGTARTWSGSLAEGTVRLERAPHLDAAFRDGVVTAMASDGEHAYAVGYEPDSQRPRLWRGDGTSWGGVRVPAAGFGGMPRDIVAGSGGVVVVGWRETAIGPSPVLWHLRSNGTWVVEHDPVVPAAYPDLSAEDCPSLATSGIEFMLLDFSLAPTCFGDGPMTFRAWSAECRDCAVPGHPPNGTSAWLLSPPRVLLLAPSESQEGWRREGVPHPELAWDDDWLNRWVEVTGHFADPAAESCRPTPPPGEEIYFFTGDAVVECLRRFVVTRVVPVDGPVGLASGGGGQGG